METLSQKSSRAEVIRLEDEAPERRRRQHPGSSVVARDFSIDIGGYALLLQ